MIEDTSENNDPHEPMPKGKAKAKSEPKRKTGPDNGDGEDSPEKKAKKAFDHNFKTLNQLKTNMATPRIVARGSQTWTEKDDSWPWARGEVIAKPATAGCGCPSKFKTVL